VTTPSTNTPKPPHVGIVAVSPEGAAVFYHQISRHASRLLPPNRQPRFSLHNEPIDHYLDAIRKDDWHAVGRLLRKSAEILARAGADFCLSPDNVVQHGVQLAEVGSPIPWLTMTDLVAQTISGQNKKVVGLVGTRMVAHSSTYQTHLGMRGIQVLVPSEPETETLEQIIFNELLYGHIRPESRAAALSIIHNLAARGCEAIILGASEAPLLISQENSPVPIYDAADILAEAAVRRVTRR
jgi:aspartate racemase